MFTNGYQSGLNDDPEEEEKPKKPVRFSMRVISAIRAKDLPPPERPYRNATTTAYVPKAERAYFSRPPAQTKKQAGISKKQKSSKMQATQTPPPVSAAGTPPAGVLSTVDYGLFHYLPSNRPIDRAHVRRLAEAIRTKNLLHLFPILVNADLNVIDGQHRLEAAKSLGTPIFYAQDDAINQDDIASMNSNKKNWSMQDYINFFASKGVTAYITFQAFCAEHDHMPVASLVALCANGGKRKTKEVQDGQLDISRIAFAKDVIGYLADFRKINNAIATSSRFIDALAFMAASDQYDHERLIGKVQLNPGALVPCANQKQYVQLLQGIYNKGVHDKNVVIFLKR